MRRWRVALLTLVLVSGCALLDNGWQRETDAGFAAYHRGDFRAAELAFERALKKAQHYGDADWRSANSLSMLALSCSQQGRLTEAESLFLRLIAIKEKEQGSEDPSVATYLSSLASLYYKQHRNSEAESLFLKAISIEEKARGFQDPEVACSSGNRA